MPSSGLRRTRMSAASIVSASWSKLPLTDNCRTCKSVIQTALLSLRISIKDNTFATVLRLYAPTLQPEIGIKEAFDHNLHNHPQPIDSKEKLLILGDFNTRVEWDFELWKGVLGRHGIGNCSNNGCLFLEFCTGLFITMRDILCTRVMPSADCYIDRGLVRCKVAFTFKPPPKRKVPRQRNCKFTDFVTQG